MKSNKAGKLTTKPKTSPRRSVWLFRAIEAELKMDGNGGLFLTTNRHGIELITLKESVAKFALYDECESDGADFNDGWLNWLQMIANAL